MATSVRFEGINAIYSPSKPLIGQPAEPPVYIFQDGKQVVSCWQLNEAERREVAATGTVWLALRRAEMTPAKVSGSALVNVGDRHARPIEVGRGSTKIN